MVYISIAKMRISYKWSMYEIIYIDRDNIMMNHHLRLNVGCNFIYATNGFLIIGLIIIYL
jgi:hypothetical protein